MAESHAKRKVVLLTGATGFTGGAIARELVKRTEEYDVRFFVRASTKKKTPAGGTTIKSSFFDPALLKQAVRGVDIVVHCAQISDYYPRNAKAEKWMRQVNEEGTRLLLQECPHVERFVLLSSTDVVGHTPKDGSAVDEETEEVPSNEWARSKQRAEALVRAWSERTGNKYVIIRATKTFGPGERFAAWELFKAAEKGFIMAYPSGGAKVMWVHCDDVARAVVAAVDTQEDKALNKVYHVAPNEAVSVKDALRQISRSLGRMGPFIPLPAALLKPVLSQLGRYMNRGKRRVFLYHAQTIDDASQMGVFSNKRCVSLLNWTPQYSVREGIDATLHYETKISKELHIKRIPTVVIVALVLLLIFHLFRWITGL